MGLPLTQIDEGYVSGRVSKNSFMYDHKYETNIVRLQSEINNLIDYFGLSEWVWTIMSSGRGCPMSGEPGELLTSRFSLSTKNAERHPCFSSSSDMTISR